MIRLFCLISLASSLLSFSNAQSLPMEEMPNRVIVKVKPEYRELCTNNSIAAPYLQSILNQLSATSVIQKFPHSEIPGGPYIRAEKKMVDISLIYEIQYSGNLSPSDASKMLMNSGCLLYAVAHRIPHPLYTPNDPDTLNSNQYYLGKISAYQAWNINKGDTNVVVGIVDSGTDWDHPDLKGNIKYNYNDPINNINDDHDSINGVSLKDNYRGWDLAMNDNNPMVTASLPASAEPLHGAVLSGLACAKTDNGKGVAGVGFNCKFLPIKVQDDVSGAFTAAFDGITYAADHGCKIINLSWGGTGAPSPFEQDIINYAAINKGCVIVAAAGNSNLDEIYYPAGYDNVLSVSGTTATDAKAGISTYNSTVDVCAPGKAIYSTLYNDTYGLYKGGDGTSYACAIVSGAAALVKSQFPAYTPQMVCEQLKITADPIDNLPQNSAYVGKLGDGRINLFRALNSPGLPSFRLMSYNVDDKNDSSLISGDTVQVYCKIRNFLNPGNQAIAMISSTSPYVKPFSSVFYLGPLANLDSVNNTAAPFQIILTGNIPPNTVIPLTITFTDFGYYHTESISFKTGNNYKDLQLNNINTTLAANSSIGYTPKPVTGMGFKYKGGTSISSEIGLMIGTDSLHLVDNIHSIAGKNDSDFVEQLAVRKLGIPSASKEDYIQIFNDDSARNKKINIQVIQKIHALKNPPSDKYITMDYAVVNTGNQNDSNLFVGLYSNWDVLGVNANKATYVDSLRLAYAYNPQQQTVFAGIQLLRPTTNANAYNIDLIAGGAGGIDASNSFTLKDKFTTLHTLRSDAGLGVSGTDIAQVVSAGPFTIKPGDTAHVSFALIGGDNIDDLLRNAHVADSIYNHPVIPSGISKKNMENAIIAFPNPSNGMIYFKIANTQNSKAILRIFNMLGQEVAYKETFLSEGHQVISYDGARLADDLYYYSISIQDSQSSGKFLIVKP